MPVEKELSHRLSNRDTILTIGVFDGVHLGHQRVLEEIAERAREMGEELEKGVKMPSHQTGLFIGLGLIIIGIYYLLDSLYIYWLSWLKWGVIWPVLVIIAGILLLVRRVRGE